MYQDKIPKIFDFHYSLVYTFRFTELDLLTPASRKGLPLTLVICRMTLQDILVNAIGSNILKNKSKVVDFIQEPSKV